MQINTLRLRWLLMSFLARVPAQRARDLERSDLRFFPWCSCRPEIPPTPSDCIPGSAAPGSQVGDVVEGENMVREGTGAV